jgi:hypothetical protein
LTGLSQFLQHLFFTLLTKEENPFLTDILIIGSNDRYVLNSD